MKIGIIGFGRLGKLITRYLAQDATVLVYDKIDYSKDITEAGGISSSLQEVCDCTVVIPFVPISSFEECILEIKDLLKPGCLVADVCSVKLIPTEIMQKHLPESVQILGTHPMFGPDSAKETLFGSKLVISKIRIEDKLYSDIKIYFEKHGLKVIEATPDQHDRQISHSLLLAHYIGRGLIELNASPLEIDTLGYRRLLKILGTVENDSWQLFEDMNHYNPYARETRKEFLAAMGALDEKVSQ
ncbi:MAG: prephenate dehydrogenase/arogenate dehydrogenase family protein [Halobacteriovoraceae bacterium]|jgi:prephenate dehydrogenase|nr:prephenate dehydrogenase/arogenate dehydrogenase family protein [Halobacteriovoraceae bacterium]MBT5093934.1 prephenate dehydrogenase/arogenate dehydrogenase family protein [Halobacteriovoraceae bacterium]